MTTLEFRHNHSTEPGEEAGSGLIIQERSTEVLTPAFPGFRPTTVINAGMPAFLELLEKVVIALTCHRHL